MEIVAVATDAAPGQLFVTGPDGATRPLLADPRRNCLHDDLGAGDDNGLVLEPSCADQTSILRAFFAWKLGLFGRCHTAQCGT